jgi:peptidoglycan/xylan/chitin deacetylase (PgdA/CDA1 family)
VIGAIATAGGALIAHLSAAQQPAPVPPSVVPVAVLAPEPIAAEADDPEPVVRDVVRDAVRTELGGASIITGGSEQRLLLFTFDDGPDPRYTRRLLEQLERRGVHAVFFLSAERFAGRSPWAENNRAIVREIAAAGHTIASHGHRHIQFTRLSSAALNAELDDAERAFVDAIGLRPVLVRPPGGARSPRTDALLSERGYTTMMWNLGTGDAQVRTADEVVETFRRVLYVREHETGTRGGIVLLHDIHAWSLEAFPRILDLIERRNCQLYEAEEEMYDVLDGPDAFIHPRGDDPSADAGWARLPDQVHAARQHALRDAAEARCGRLAMR